MTYPFEIHPATEKDLPQLIKGIKQLAKNESSSENVTVTEELLKKALFKKGAHTEAVMVFKDHTPIGYGIFYHNFSTFLSRPGLHIQNFFIDPTIKDNGLYQCCFTYFAHLALKRKCARLEWRVFNNDKAIRFYEGVLKAEVMDEWTIYRLLEPNLSQLAATDISDKLTISRAEEKDVPLILDYIKQLAEYEKLSHEVVATKALLQEYLFGEKKYAEVVFAHHERQPVGFALYFHNFSSSFGHPGIYLEDLYVDPTMRGKGIGMQLLSYLANLSLQKKCLSLEWWVLNWNKTAIGFYERIGAKPLNKQTVYRLSGDLLDELGRKFDDL